MDLQELEARGLIERASYNQKQITANLDRAQRDLTTAKANLNIDQGWAYTIAYHAMLRAGRALMFGSGYRPRGKDQHKTVVEFCAEILGKEFQHLTSRFNRMRIKRHDFVYEPERPISETEAGKSIESAEKFVKEMIRRVNEMVPQKQFF